MSYQAIQNVSVDLDQNPFPLEEYDPYTSPVLAIDTLNIHDILDQTFSSNEAIMELMNISEWPWEDMHHRSSFLSKPDSLDVKPENFYLDDDMERYQCPIQTHNVLSKGNLKNISKTNPINISIKPNIIKNINIGSNFSLEEIRQYIALFKDICDVFTWSYEEITGIDPSIVKHEIKTYPN